MPTSDERAAALRSRLEHLDLPTAPNDSSALTRMSLQSMMRDSGVAPQERDPRLDVRLHGAAIPAHDVPVREATSILGSLQEAVSACGQAIAQKATAAGSLSASILRATELRFSPALGFGSVVFHLGGATEALTGDEIPETIGTETLLDKVFQELFMVLDFAEKDQIMENDAVEQLRHLGPRLAKHLNELAKEIMDSEIDVGLTWRSRSFSADTALKRRGALALKDAIERNREEVSRQTLSGVLSTVSTVVRPQLTTLDGRRIDMSVDVNVAATLGSFYNREVEVDVEVRRLWSIATDRETLNYKLLSIRFSEEGENPRGELPRS
ncbi:hypothetical protein ACWEPI_20510 [Streptomyces sp. NPDC004262]